MPIRITSVSAARASRSQRVSRVTLVGSLWPVTTANDAPWRRSVIGIPANASAPKIAETPGTTSNGIPASAHARGLLASAAEHVRIAALQAHDGAALRGEPEQERRRLLLGARRRVVAALADVDAQRFRRREIEQRLGGERVVDDRVRAAQRVRAAHRDQIRCARPRADEDHLAGSAHAEARARSFSSSAAPPAASTCSAARAAERLRIARIALHRALDRRGAVACRAGARAA